MPFPDDVPLLTRGDVTLRAHRLDDAGGIVEQCTDPVSIRWTTVPVDYDLAMAERRVTAELPARWEDASEYVFAVESTHPDGDRRFSGSVSLRNLGDGQAEVAFGAHPAIRGRGVLTTAVNLLLDYGFDECGFETVVWYAEVGNLASRRVAWKTGFRFGGVMPKWLNHRGSMLDAWVATLHRDDPRDPTTPWFDVPHIVGDIVTLRPFREVDAARIAEGCADPRTQEWLEFLPSPYTLEDAHEFLIRVGERACTGQGITWAAVDPGSDELLAAVGIPRIDHGSYEVGYWAHPDARGRGVVSEGVRMLLRHVFLDVEDGGLGVRRAFLRAAAGNSGFAEDCHRQRFRRVRARARRDAETRRIDSGHGRVRLVGERVEGQPSMTEPPTTGDSGEPRRGSIVREATATDLPAIEGVIYQAFAPYMERIGVRPFPMDADYPGLVDPAECGSSTASTDPCAVCSS